MLPGALALAALAVHAISPRLRRWRAVPFLGAAALAAVAVGGAWLWALAARAPELTGAWWALALRTEGGA